MLDYKLIHAFATVIATGSFAKAAKKLFLTQSAISQRVKSLEEQAGQILVIRSSPPKPTEAGIRYMTLYNQVSHLEELLENKSTGKNTKEFQQLKIAVNADTLATWLFDIFDPYLANKNITLELHVDDQDQTHHMLKNGKVLACIGTHKHPIQGCNCIYLGYERYNIYTSETFFEKWFADGVTENTITNAPAVNFNNKDKLNEQILSSYFGKEINPRNQHFIPSTDLFAKFIIAGFGYGAMPEHQIKKMGDQTGLIKLPHLSDLKVKLYYHCWNIQSPLIDDFTTQLRKKTEEILNQDD